MPETTKPKRSWLRLGGAALAVGVIAVAIGASEDRTPPSTAPARYVIPPDEPAAVAGAPAPSYVLAGRSTTLAAPPADDDTATDDAATDDAVPVAVAAPTQQASGPAGVPDGEYACRTWSGSSYIGLGTLRSTNGSLANSVLTGAGATITGATPTAEGVTLLYTSARGFRESMDCTRQ